MSHGFTEEKKVYSTSGPDAALFDTSTAFSVNAKFTGPSDTESLACGQNGRNNNPIKVTVKFIGYYGSNPNNQKTVEIKSTWIQDSKDMLRQEYVDMTPPDERAELPVPSKSSFVYTISSNGVDQWNTGHYGYMIDDGLKSKKSSWLAKVNKLYREGKRDPDGNTLTEFTDTDFQVNSGYRNPYHQRFHVGSNAFHSRHPFGDALDIQTLDVDGDGLGPNRIEQVHGNESKSDDGVAMQRAAEAANAKYTASWKDYTTQHTHADWTTRGYAKWPPKPGTVYSTPCQGPSGTSSSAPLTLTTTTTSTTTTPSTPTYHACSVHEDWQSGDHSLQASCSLTNANGDNCTVTNFYACQSHTCVFPEPTTDSDTDDDSNYAYCTRFVKKKRWSVIRVEKRKGRHIQIYGWEYYWETCGERYNIHSTDECEGAYDGNRTYRHSSE